MMSQDTTKITDESLEKALGDLVACPICGRGVVFEKQASWYTPFFDKDYFEYLVLMYQRRALEIQALGNEKGLSINSYIISCKIEMTINVLQGLLDNPDRLKALYEQDSNERMADFYKQREEFVSEFLEMPSSLDMQHKPGEKLGSFRCRRYTRAQAERLKQWVRLLDLEDEAGSNP